MRTFLLQLLCIACLSANPEQATAQTPHQLNPVAPVDNTNRTYFSVGDAPSSPTVGSAAATAKAPFGANPKFFRNSPTIAAAAKPLTAPFTRCVVEIRDRDANQIALATVVSKKNHIVTKYSLVKDRRTVSLQFLCGNQTFTGQLVGYDDSSDMALFALSSVAQDIKKEPLQPVTFAGANSIGFGKVVVSPDHGGDSLAIGITTRSPIEPKAIECVDCVDFGLTLTEKLTVTRVYPGTAGDRLGVRVGDTIESVNGKPVSAAAAFREIEKATKVGDMLTIDILRNGARDLISGKVPDRTIADKRDRWGGGPFSKRRFGFSGSFHHDSVIDPESCGGPLVDLGGKFQGVNIARSSRVASVTIQANTVRQFLMRYLSAEDLDIQR